MDTCLRIHMTGFGVFGKEGEEHLLWLRFDLIRHAGLGRAHVGMPPELAAISDLPAEGLLALVGALGVETFREEYFGMRRKVKAKSADLLWLMPDYYVLAAIVTVGGLYFRQPVKPRGGWIGTVASHFEAHWELVVLGFCPIRSFGRVCRVVSEGDGLRFDQERIVDSMAGTGYRGGRLWSVYDPSPS